MSKTQWFLEVIQTDEFGLTDSKYHPVKDETKILEEAQKYSQLKTLENLQIISNDSDIGPDGAGNFQGAHFYWWYDWQQQQGIWFDKNQWAIPENIG